MGEEQPIPDVEVGSIAETRMLQERFKDGSKETITRAEYKPLAFDKDAAYALLSRETFDEKGKLTDWDLRVNSPHLLEVFRKVVGSHPAVPATYEEPFSIESPFRVLIHHWDDLEKHRATMAGGSTEAEHTDLLLRFMSTELATPRRRALDFIATRRISFEDLWMIYRPGDVMTTSERGHDWLLKLEDTAYEKNCNTRYFEVRCKHAFFDGEKLVSRRKTFKITEVGDVPGHSIVPVDSLSVYPRSFLREGDALEKRLQDRGECYASLTGTPCMQYDGLSEYCKSPPSSFFRWDMDDFDTVWLPQTETARVVLDPKTFLEDFNKEAETIDKAFSPEFDAWCTKTYGTVQRARSILAPPFTYGYSLIRKTWCKYFIDGLTPVVWNARAAESLILPGAEKALLSALVTAHEFPSNARDVAMQKGKGLVVLLHGTPGSGKTLTAEVSAELAHAPLMPISLRELYEYTFFDELRLKTYLAYATTWRAVVLVDEADVFLETRSSGDDKSADRNALVAVFLRYLEYFSGIIFLTSNRVADFDPAVKSRVHVALQYDPPADMLRRRIWIRNLMKLFNEGKTDWARRLEVEASVNRLVAVDMNGREISNAVNTAMTLARSEGTKLSVQHLETVIDVWKGFERNLAALKAEKSTAKKTIVEASTNGH